MCSLDTRSFGFERAQRASVLSSEQGFLFVGFRVVEGLSGMLAKNYLCFGVVDCSDLFFVRSIYRYEECA